MSDDPLTYFLGLKGPKNGFSEYNSASIIGKTIKFGTVIACTKRMCLMTFLKVCEYACANMKEKQDGRQNFFFKLTKFFFSSYSIFFR